MTACLIIAAVAGGFLLGLATLVAGRIHRRHRFEPLPDLPPRSVTRWPPREPVHVLEEPVFHDAELEGWWSR